MKKVAHNPLKIYRPLIVILALAAFFVVARLVLAQTPVPTATANPSDFKSFSEILGLITQLLILAGIAVAVVYFFWRGKSNEQLKEMVAGWKDTAERRGQRNAELEAEKIRDKTEIERLKHNRIEDRKKYLRLLAKHAGEEIEDIEDEI